MMTQLSPRRTLGRRSVLGGGAALAAATATGCTFFSTEPDAGGGAGSGTDADLDVMESPMLTERVDAGELPPLEERIPSDPLVVDAAEIGSYGGTMRSVTIGPGDRTSILRLIGYEPGLRRDAMLESTVPNVFSAVEQADEDGMVYTISLRSGMKWSDGEPFTADDVVFAIEDVYGDEELHPSPPGWLSIGGEKAIAEKVDDVTVTLTFASPTGLFMPGLDRNMDWPPYFPKHYCQDFLPAYNDDLDAKVEEAGMEVWTDLWNDQIAIEGVWKNVELPTLFGWVCTTPLGETGSVVLERNPYFWKTDAQGRQLPYVDTLSFEVVADPEVITLKTTDGELDIMFRHANSSSNKPVFADAAESGGIRLVDTTATSMNSMCIALNLAHKDQAKAELYRNKDFRIGLSHAINREEIITAVWQRQGEPWQWAPHADSRFYDEEFAKQYTEFDVDLANEHLDAAGLTERDSDGFRTMPDGDTLTITLDTPNAIFPEWPPAASMISTMWGEVGIRMSVNSLDRTLFYDRKTAGANEIDAGMWGGDGGLAVEDIDPRWYMPFSDESVWATPWAAYYNSRGEGGEEPVPAALEQIELMWQHAETPDEEERTAIFQQVLDIAKEEFWGIGLSSSPNPYWVVKNRVRNIIEGVPDTWVYMTPGHANPETWFLAEGA
ncbi:ABC transporter substrate-binding protein [Brachybacterium saurashtrense]|nr:ABC transporter substrate-binding protein [Brachybacterium saurashtrense]